MTGTVIVIRNTCHTSRTAKSESKPKIRVQLSVAAKAMNRHAKQSNRRAKSYRIATRLDTFATHIARRPRECGQAHSAYRYIADKKQVMSKSHHDDAIDNMPIPELHRTS
jgi:hypothetical protein